MNKLNVSFDEKAIDAIFGDLDQSRLPGAAVGIAIGGVPVYRKGFGLASMELPVTLTPQTRMRIYSITKHFTCLAYLLLCEEGKAGVDDPIGKYLPELNLVTRHVTMRQLMSHTSGLRDACDIRWFFSGIESTVPADDLLALYRDIHDVNFPPGQAWCYNNGAYHILSAVITKIANQPLEDVFRERIFEPAGMQDSLLRRIDTDFVPNSATMHMLGPGKLFERRLLPGELCGEGGIVSTVNDMMRWMRNVANPVVGRAETWRLMSTSHRLSDGVETGYGLGLFRRPYRGEDALSHAGGGLGSNSQFIRLPSADIDVIVLVNRSDVSSLELAARILDVCLGIKPESTRSDGKYPTGLFRSAKTGRVIQLYRREERQIAAFDGGEGMQMEAKGSNELTPAPCHFWNSSVKWHEYIAEPERIRYELFGGNDELKSVPCGPAQEFERIVGDYLSPRFGARLTVWRDAEGGCLTSTGKFGSRTYRLAGLGPGIWRIKAADGTPWSGTLTVESAGDKLVLNTFSTWKVQFGRTC